MRGGKLTMTERFCEERMCSEDNEKVCDEKEENGEKIKVGYLCDC